MGSPETDQTEITMDDLKFYASGQRKHLWLSRSLLYSFGAARWTVHELRQIDVSTPKVMHMQQSLHSGTSVSR